MNNIDEKFKENYLASVVNLYKTESLENRKGIKFRTRILTGLIKDFQHGKITQEILDLAREELEKAMVQDDIQHNKNEREDFKKKLQVNPVEESKNKEQTTEGGLKLEMLGILEKRKEDRHSINRKNRRDRQIKNNNNSKTARGER